MNLREDFWSSFFKSVVPPNTQHQYRGMTAYLETPEGCVSGVVTSYDANTRTLTVLYIDQGDVNTVQWKLERVRLENEQVAIPGFLLRVEERDW